DQALGRAARLPPPRRGAGAAPAASTAAAAGRADAAGGRAQGVRPQRGQRHRLPPQPRLLAQAARGRQ
ncbi:hypothetical protein TSOC_006222, partial [Tetrabaena socialis]